MILETKRLILADTKLNFGFVLGKADRLCTDATASAVPKRNICHLIAVRLGVVIAGGLQVLGGDRKIGLDGSFHFVCCNAVCQIFSVLRNRLVVRGSGKLEVIV